jgi:hypothetical protein
MSWFKKKLSKTDYRERKKLYNSTYYRKHRRIVEQEKQVKREQEAMVKILELIKDPKKIEDFCKAFNIPLPDKVKDKRFPSQTDIGERILF